MPDSWSSRAGALLATLEQWAAAGLVPRDQAEAVGIGFGELLRDMAARAVAERRRADELETHCRNWRDEVFPSAVKKLEEFDRALKETNERLAEALSAAEAFGRHYADHVHPAAAARAAAGSEN